MNKAIMIEKIINGMVKSKEKKAEAANIIGHNDTLIERSLKKDISEVTIKYTVGAANEAQNPAKINRRKDVFITTYLQ